ncbi:MAG: putative zinc-binding metallopeptidase [Pirellulales bacterium]
MNSNHRKPSGSGRTAVRRSGKEPAWAHLADEELLNWRICDLGLEIEGTVLQERIERLCDELQYRGLRFRPHFWLSDEWFSPDGVPGVAIPFALAHPRLAALERKLLLEVEGGTEDWCLRILRHEAGHAVDTAYRLHRRLRYRKIFGKYTAPYPDYYHPKPYSKNYVLHLEPSYAQAHPAEDFAETFAVWLKPRSTWRSTYDGWPAIKKLEYVAALMQEIRGVRPPVNSREQIDPLRKLRKTLREHYDRKRDQYGINLPNLYDQHLRKLFSDAPEHSGQPSAAAFLRRNRTELRKTVAHWTGEYQYIIDQVLEEMIDRCRELNLRLDRPVEQAQRDALALVTVQTMNYIHGGHHRVAL